MATALTQPLVRACAGGLAASPLLKPAQRWMGRVPLFWRTLPPPPGHMPRSEPIKIEDVGMTYLVHSGKEHRRVRVTAQMVGHKYGEFVLTRKVGATRGFFSPRSAVAITC